jgi:hypothetical protein
MILPETLSDTAIILSSSPWYLWIGYYAEEQQNYGQTLN